MNMPLSNMEARNIIQNLSPAADSDIITVFFMINPKFYLNLISAKAGTLAEKYKILTGEYN